MTTEANFRQAVETALGPMACTESNPCGGTGYYDAGEPEPWRVLFYDGYEETFTTAEAAIAAAKLFCEDSAPLDTEVVETTTTYGATLYMTREQVRRWNAGDITDEDYDTILCVVPTSEPDRSYVRNGEVILHPGMPSSWRGTLSAAEEEHADWLDEMIEGRAVDIVDICE